MEVPEHLDIRRLARRFLEEEGPALARYEEEEAFPWPLVERMGELGFLGVFVPEELGGAGLDFWAYVALLEGLGGYASLREKRQFGRAIAGFQLVQAHLAQMKLDQEASRFLTYQAEARKLKGQRYTLEASMAKLFASEAANRVAYRAIQVHGGWGHGEGGKRDPGEARDQQARPG